MIRNNFTVPILPPKPSVGDGLTINKLRESLGLVEIPEPDPSEKNILSVPETKDNINHPSHYTYGKMEVIEVIDAFNCNFEQGNIIKYVLRYKHKNGIEDLKKAQWYLDHLIQKEMKNES